MYNVVRVAVKGDVSADGLISRLSGVVDGNENCVVYFDTHKNGATFLVEETSMNRFQKAVENFLSSAGGSIAGATSTSDGCFLLIINSSRGNLRQLDDDRANELWNN